MSHQLPDECLAFQVVARGRAPQIVDQSTDLLFAVLSAATLVVPKSRRDAFSGTFAVTGVIPDADAPGFVEEVDAINTKFEAVSRHSKLGLGDMLIYPAVQDTHEESQYRVDRALAREVEDKDIVLLPVTTVEEALQYVLFHLLSTQSPIGSPQGQTEMLAGLDHGS